MSGAQGWTPCPARSVRDLNENLFFVCAFGAEHKGEHVARQADGSVATRWTGGDVCFWCGDTPHEGHCPDEAGYVS